MIFSKKMTWVSHFKYFLKKLLYGQGCVLFISFSFPALAQGPMAELFPSENLKKQVANYFNETLEANVKKNSKLEPVVIKSMSYTMGNIDGYLAMAHHGSSEMAAERMGLGGALNVLDDSNPQNFNLWDQFTGGKKVGQIVTVEIESKKYAGLGIDTKKVDFLISKSGEKIRMIPLGFDMHNGNLHVLNTLFPKLEPYSNHMLHDQRLKRDAFVKLAQERGTDSRLKGWIQRMSGGKSGKPGKLAGIGGLVGGAMLVWGDDMWAGTVRDGEELNDPEKALPPSDFFDHDEWVEGDPAAER